MTYVRPELALIGAAASVVQTKSLNSALIFDNQVDQQNRPLYDTIGLLEAEW